VYLEYFRLKEPPFNITPDPRFLFFSAKHREAFNHLLFGIRERKGFIELTGEVGAGKTTLCRKLLEQLGPNYKTALILNPCLTHHQMLKAILAEFDLPHNSREKFVLLDRLNKYLLETVNGGHDVVLLIDEAQDLTDDMLEQVRLLSNLETERQKLLQIVLMGQPELRDKLQKPALRQLYQRITIRYHLGPLDLYETAAYIQHRLAVAGANGTLIFDAGAVREIYDYAQGVPRLINAVCDKALLAGFVQQTTVINKKLVRIAAKELRGKIE
jgi:general secretion pathway protein A